MCIVYLVQYNGIVNMTVLVHYSIVVTTLSTDQSSVCGALQHGKVASATWFATACLVLSFTCSTLPSSVGLAVLALVCGVMMTRGCFHNGQSAG